MIFNRLSSLAEPVDPSDATTKTYADGKITAPITSVVDTAVAVFNGTLGKTIKQSPVKISDAGVIEGISSVNGFLAPTFDYAYDLGDASFNWASVHTASLQSNNGFISLENNRLTALGTPTDDTDAFTKL